MKKILLLMAITVAGMTITSCSNEDAEQQFKTIVFSPSVSSLTRVSPKTAWITEGDDADAFKVLAVTEESGNPVTLINNEAVSYQNGLWQTASKHYWPAYGSQIDFYAYYPVSLSEVFNYNAGNAPTITYAVPAAADEQVDILAAHAAHTPSASNSVVALEFNHMLSGVYFTYQSEGIAGTLKSITISNHYSAGTYTIGTGWASLNTVRSLTLSPNLDISLAESANKVVVPVAAPYLVMPQTLADGSTISVVFEDAKGITHNLSTELSQLEWPQGSLVEYIISISSIYELNITSSIQAWAATVANQVEVNIN
jgi:hypothetical protein